MRGNGRKLQIRAFLQAAGGGFPIGGGFEIAEKRPGCPFQNRRRLWHGQFLHIGRDARAHALPTQPAAYRTAPLLRHAVFKHARVGDFKADLVNVLACHLERDDVKQAVVVVPIHAVGFAPEAQFAQAFFEGFDVLLHGSSRFRFAGVPISALAASLRFRRRQTAVARRFGSSRR